MTADEYAAVKAFIDWLFEVGPDPSSMTREKLIALYEATLVARARLQ